MSYPALPTGSNRRGATMGRYGVIDTACCEKLHLYRLKMVDGDYDEGGAYWGYIPGTALFRAISPTTENEMFVRAVNRDEAKAKILEVAPKVRFFR